MIKLRQNKSLILGIVSIFVLIGILILYEFVYDGGKQVYDSAENLTIERRQAEASLENLIVLYEKYETTWYFYEGLSGEYEQTERMIAEACMNDMARLYNDYMKRIKTYWRYNLPDGLVEKLEYKGELHNPEYTESVE